MEIEAYEIKGEGAQGSRDIPTLGLFCTSGADCPGAEAS